MTSPVLAPAPAVAPSWQLTDRQLTARLVDPELPVVSDLLTDQVPGPLAAAVATMGGTITAVAVDQVTWWPGRSITVQWDAIVEGGSLAGRSGYVGTTLPAPDNALVLGAGNDAVTIWRVPHDPFLPGMAAALDPRVAAGVVADLGGQLVDPTTRLRAYRPTRRAVIEVTGRGHRLYFKLVKPKRLDALHRRHSELSGRLPVPEPLGINRDIGLLAMSAMTGSTLREALEDPAAELPPPSVVAGLGRTIPTLTNMARIRSSIEQLPPVAELLTALLPTQADRIARLAEAIGDDEVTERVPAHGDFHEAQVLVEGGQVVGVLDVDTVGLARPGDDPSAMLGHLAVWATMTQQPGRVRRYAKQLQRNWDVLVDPVDLRLRTAARIIGLATGPFRAQCHDWPLETSRRLDMAQRWVESAARARQGTATATPAPLRRMGGLAAERTSS